MDATEIIKVLNKEFEIDNQSNKIFFILQKKIIPNSIKAYKTYEYTLWYINDKTKYKATRMEHTARVVTEKEEADMIKYMDSQLLHYIFRTLQDPVLIADMKKGNFTGYGI